MRIESIAGGTASEEGFLRGLQIQIVKTSKGYAVELDSLIIGDFHLLTEAWNLARKLFQERTNVNAIILWRDKAKAKCKLH